MIMKNNILFFTEKKNEQKKNGRILKIRNCRALLNVSAPAMRNWNSNELLIKLLNIEIIFQLIFNLLDASYLSNKIQAHIHFMSPSYILKNFQVY